MNSCCRPDPRMRIRPRLPRARNRGRLSFGTVWILSAEGRVRLLFPTKGSGLDRRAAPARRRSRHENLGTDGAARHNRQTQSARQQKDSSTRQAKYRVRVRATPNLSTIPIPFSRRESVRRRRTRKRRKGNAMSYRKSHRKIMTVVAIAALGVACVSTDAAARRGGVAWRGGGGGGAVAWRGGVNRGGAVAWRGGVNRGGAVAWRGGVNRGGAIAVGGGPYWRPGVGAAVVGGAAIGAAAASSYYNAPQCGYYPYPPCY